MRSKTDESSQAKLEKIEDELAEKYSEKMVKTILNEVKGMSKSDEGGLNTGKLWNLKKKQMPRNKNIIDVINLFPDIFDNFDSLFIYFF